MTNYFVSDIIKPDHDRQHPVHPVLVIPVPGAGDAPRGYAQLCAGLCSPFLSPHPPPPCSPLGCPTAPRHTVRQAAEQLLQPADRPVLGMLEVLAEIVRNEDMIIEDLTKPSNFNSSNI